MLKAFVFKGYSPVSLNLFLNFAVSSSITSFQEEGETFVAFCILDSRKQSFKTSFNGGNTPTSNDCNAWLQFRGKQSRKISFSMACFTVVGVMTSMAITYEKNRFLLVFRKTMKCFIYDSNSKYCIHLDSLQPLSLSGGPPTVQDWLIFCSWYTI